MAVTDTNTMAGPYVGNGSTTVFPFSFAALSRDEVGVVVDKVVLASAEYSVNLEDKSVTLNTAPVAGAVLYVLSDPSFEQQIQFENGSRWLADPVNEANDRAAVRAIWLRDRVMRAPQLPLVPGEAAGQVAVVTADGAWDFGTIPGDDGGFRVDAAQGSGSSLVGFQQVGTGAAPRSAQSKLREQVSVLDYGAVGDGETDDSAAILAAINANKGGTIILPAGKRFYAAGLIFSGSTYNNTRLVIEGELLMLANPNPAAGNFQTVTYCAIVFHDCDGCSLAVRGAMDGNRLNQPASQQHYLVMIAGATNFTMDDGWTAREIRGDAVCITHKDLLVESTNSDTIYIGTGVVTNSADDGRNAVSVLSGKNITVQGGISRKVGGIINGERMPGGFDCEPDHDRGHYIENLTVGFWSVETIGTSGFAIIGASMTNEDGNRDWNIMNVQCAGAIVKHTDTTGLIGGPIFRRARNITCAAITLTRASRSAGIEIDYLDDGSFPSVIAQGCSTPITIGFYNFVNGSDINCFVSDYSASAVLAVGVNTSNVRIRARQPSGTGTYGLNRDNAGRIGLAQVGTTFALDCPYSPALTAAVRNGSVIAGSATILRGGSLLGYPDFSAQMIAADPANIIPSENVIGRNYASTVPTTGTWASDDFVKRVGIAAGASPGWYNTAPGTAVWKQAAAVAA